MANTVAENVRMCAKHKKHVPECPRCQQVGRVEEHQDGFRNVKPTVAVYRFKGTSSNKYKADGKLVDGFKEGAI